MPVIRARQIIHTNNNFTPLVIYYRLNNVKIANATSLVQ